jgi:putative FmdB family regulatory protein
MPTYDYRCKKCGHRFELFHSIKDETPKRCPKCKSRAERVPAGGAGLLFKGSGFYITDYRSDSYKEKKKADTSGGGASSDKSGSSEKSSSKSPDPAKSKKKKGE